MQHLREGCAPSAYRETVFVNNFGKNIALWVIILLLLVALFNLFQQPSDQSSQATVPYSTFLAEVQNGQIDIVTIKGRTITGARKDGRAFSTYAPNDPGLVEKLNATGVTINAAPADNGSPSLLNILMNNLSEKMCWLLVLDWERILIKILQRILIHFHKLLICCYQNYKILD